MTVVQTSDENHSHPSAAHKAACPVCNPDKTVPQLNAAYAQVSSNERPLLAAATALLESRYWDRNCDCEKCAVFRRLSEAVGDELTRVSKQNAHVVEVLAADGRWLPVGAGETSKDAQETMTHIQSCSPEQVFRVSEYVRAHGNETGEPQPCPIPEANGFSIQGKEIGPGIWGVGNVSWHPESGDWRGMADINGALCVVTLKVTAQKAIEPRLAGRASGE